ncbi:MAG: lipid A biosynthesis acyltransferase [Woeseiaceae bacterium]|jgi:Kdo2-lipid IVA lauroyltransferase/acyltransferase
MSDRKPLSAYRGPGTWPIWFGLGLLRLVCLLPHRAALAIGSGIGRLVHALGGTRRAIVRRNIDLCFPELDRAARDELVREHFKALGMALIEMGLARWASDRHLESITTLSGVRHLLDVLESGRGAILLTAHFTSLELSGRVFSRQVPPFDCVYRQNRSEFITELQRSGREMSAETAIEKRDIKKMVRSLRKGRAVWYAPDQSYSRKGAEVVEFFGIPSMHTTATSTLARLGDAAVIPFFQLRNPDGTYAVTLLPPFEDFPGDDPVADTERYVAVLEEQIRKAPEQYFWIHRKFKDLPEGYPDYYADLDALK